MQQSTREQGVHDNERSVALPGLVSPDYRELFDTSIKCILNWMRLGFQMLHFTIATKPQNQGKIFLQ
jgi:hypothetical protein